jgi:hypothetical protein
MSESQAREAEPRAQSLGSLGLHGICLLHFFAGNLGANSRAAGGIRFLRPFRST